MFPGNILEIIPADLLDTLGQVTAGEGITVDSSPPSSCIFRNKMFVHVWLMCRGVMPCGQRKRNVERTRSRGRKAKQAEVKNAPEITCGSQV